MALEEQLNWKEPLHDFKAWIWGVRVPGSQDPTAGLDDFVPAGEVEAYLRQPGKLGEILGALFGDGGDDIDAEQLVDRYSVVFAILVAIDYGTYIGRFLPHESLVDAKLPFDDRPRTFPDQGVSDTFFQQFRIKQARFCASKIYEGNRKIPWEEHLPFLEKELVGEGGSAKVYRVKIHANHDFLSKPESPPGSRERHKFYALKAYEGDDGEKWHRTETATFRKLHRTGLRDAHIIGYHCSFEHRGVCYALLEYADLDTLEHFMMRQSNGPPSTDTEILSFWENLLHVIQAIGEIHELDPHKPYAAESGKFTSIHQDIKPTNILVKTKEHASSIYDSAFGLADLGTSSLVKVGSPLVARDNFGTKTYGSPECFRRDSIDDGRNIIITTKADIWSFGCVLSEVCIWVVFGSSGEHGLNSYRQRRRKYNSRVRRGGNAFHLSGGESQAVHQEHGKVAAQSRCDPITAAILQLIPKMLQLDPEHRPSAQQLRKLFDEIISDAKVRVSQGGLSSVDENRISRKPRSITHPPPPSKPLGQRRNRRLTGSTGSTGSGAPSAIDITVGNGPMIPDALQTDTPRTLTLQDDTHHVQHHVRLPSFSYVKAPDMISQKLSQIKIEGHATADTADTARTPPHSGTSTNAQEHQFRRESNSTVRSAQDLKSKVELEKKNEQEQTHNSGSLPSPSPKPPNNNNTTVHPDDVGISQNAEIIKDRPRGPPAKLSFEDAVKWKRQKKAGKMLSDLTDQNLFSQLRGRDHVFVVDDSRSMGDMRRASREKHESEVADYIDLLGYMVKHCDRDGIDLHYFNSTKVIKRAEKVTPLVSSVNGTKFAGLSNPQGTLRGILEAYIRKLKAYTTEVADNQKRSRRMSKLFSADPKLPTPLSVYVLTDGVWESPDSAGGEYIDDTIEELIEALRSAGCKRVQVGIQFIRFGSHTHGVQRLEALDRLGTAHGMELDIVDTEPIQGGNIWKMLLGAINPRFDADENLEVSRE